MFGKVRFAIGFLGLFVLGLFFCISSLVDQIKATSTDIDFNTLTKADFKEGMYVKGTVYEIYDEYAVEESYEQSGSKRTNERVTAHYYVIPLADSFETDTPQYITLKAGHKDIIPKAERLMQQTWNYYDYDIQPEQWAEFEIVGEVTLLEDDLISYLYEWFMYGDDMATRADYEPYICPYKITYHDVGSHTTTILLFAGMAVVGAVGLGVMVFVYLKHR